MQFAKVFNTYNVAGLQLADAGDGYFFGVQIAQPQVVGVGTSVANQTRVFQFVLPFSTVVRKITTEVTTDGGVGKKYGVGLYNAAGTRLLHTGALDGHTVQVNQTTIGAVTLAAGVYYLAWTTDANAVELRVATRVAPIDTFLTTATAKIGLAANASVAGVLPATLGVIGAAGLTPVLALFEP